MLARRVAELEKSAAELRKSRDEWMEIADQLAIEKLALIEELKYARASFAEIQGFLAHP